MSSSHLIIRWDVWIGDETDRRGWLVGQYRLLSTAAAVRDAVGVAMRCSTGGNVSVYRREERLWEGATVTDAPIE